MKYSNDKAKRKKRKLKEDLNSILITAALKAYIKEKGRFPNDKEIDSLPNALVDALPETSKMVTKTLKKNAEEMLLEQSAYQNGFEERLYALWKGALDLLECLIRISLEAGQAHKNKLDKAVEETNKYKFAALVQIHARALQVSNEILVLLKAGFAEGALARWRTLYELAVVSYFLKDNDDGFSVRYMVYRIVRISKDADDYQRYYKRLNYPPIADEEFRKIKEREEELFEEYGGNSDENFDWDWARSEDLPNPYFRAIAKCVGLDHLLPFYNLASAAAHGLSRGFYRLGLAPDLQNAVLLCGASVYGLADPLQLTAICLNHVTLCLLNLQLDTESLLVKNILGDFVKETEDAVVLIQKGMENEVNNSQETI